MYKTTGSLWFYSKYGATNFNANITNANDFKYFKYKAKLLGNTEVDGANGILQNATTAVPLKYLSNFWISLKMPLISCKVELKLKWIKYCILSAGANIMLMIMIMLIIFSFTIKDNNICSCCNFISKRQ